VKRGASRQAAPVAVRMAERAFTTVCVVVDNGIAEELSSDLSADPRRGSVELWRDVEAMLM
jgi:hypothetical protein